MSKLKGIWADAVWSKVIATAIIALAGIVITYSLKMWPAIGAAVVNVFAFLGASSSVPNWLIGFGAACFLVVLFLIAAIIWRAIFPSATTNTWRSYVTDNFFGLRWHWQYGFDGGIFSLYSFCEDCDYQIHPENVSGYSAAPRFVYRCDICGRLAGPFEEEPLKLESKVKRLIQQKLRTGSWANEAS